MADGSRSMRWRAAIMVVGAVLVLMYLYSSGRMTQHVFQIDYSWGGDYLDGAEVEIDGEVVGILEPAVGRQRIIGFEVEPGVHVVKILHDRCTSRPDTAEVGGDAGRLVIRMADITDEGRCKIVLR